MDRKAIDRYWDRVQEGAAALGTYDECPAGSCSSCDTARSFLRGMDATGQLIAARERGELR